MASILKRPLDLFIIVCLFIFLLIALTIDFTQSTYGSVTSMKDVQGGIWPPQPILRAYVWWCQTYDPLLSKNAVWYETMAWFSPFLYAPFYPFCIYAFIHEKEWIRIPALLWSYGLLLTMFVILREELIGVLAAPDVLIMILAYGAYVLVPAIVFFRVSWTPVFNSSKKTHKN